MIVLTRDTATVGIDVNPEALCVYHPSYAPPALLPFRVEWKAFVPRARDLMKGRSALVVVGLNKMMTPSNRTDPIFELLFNLTPEWRKVSIDHALFVGQPWRAWFHFGLCGAPYREYTYSYLAESHWKAAQDGAREDDPFCLESILACGRGVVRSDHERYFDRLEVETVAVSATVHEAYAAEKAVAFAEEHTIAPIIRRLAKIAQDACPQRTIPQVHRMWAKRRHHIVCTDLAVDRYLVGELVKLATLTDAIAEGFHHAS